jgi:hypothetical protein
MAAPTAPKIAPKIRFSLIMQMLNYRLFLVA